MDDYKKLGQSTIFKIAFYLPILFGLSLLLVTAYNNPDYSLCLSSECVNNFFDLYKYPISVMGLSIPLSAIAAAIHRSEETSRQILLTQSQFNETLTQNKFSNYIKHKEDFFELIKNMENVCKCKFNDPLNTYKKIFPHNSYLKLDFKSHPRTSSHHLNELLDKLQHGIWSAAMILYEPDASEDQYVAFIVEIQDLTQYLELGCAPEPEHEHEHEQSNPKLIWSDNYAEISYKNLSYIINGLISFSSFKYSDTATFKKMWALRRAEKAWSVYSNNVIKINKIMSEIDVNTAL